MIVRLWLCAWLAAASCAHAEAEGLDVATTQHRIDNRAPPTNWGKTFPFGRGEVEYVRLKFPEPRDVTLYLGVPHSQLFNYMVSNPLTVSVGSGGTSFDYVIAAPGAGLLEGEQSIRGTVLHFCADEIYVRGNTSLPGFNPSPAIAATIRFGAQAGLGTPVWHERMRGQQRLANGDAAVAFDLSAWSVRARLDVIPTAANLNPITGFTVTQTRRDPGGVTDVTEPMPIAPYLTGNGSPLSPYANGLRVTTTGGGGPGPAGPPAGGSYRFLMTETFFY